MHFQNFRLEDKPFFERGGMHLFRHQRVESPSSHNFQSQLNLVVVNNRRASTSLMSAFFVASDGILLEIHQVELSRLADGDDNVLQFQPFS
ncbi:hypothetical protein C5167_010648 [Papaver somniferum]|uniref:Uncharacterized protein n=1 Tax=Papaver somniferum TaxID=3469 RepID=A0A4Y7K3P5_PAPSO|nr:hypothetical protein C5167_010648 [Papaver somniferum]